MKTFHETANFICWMDRASGYLHSGSTVVTLECTREGRLELYNYDNSKLPAYLIYAALKTTFGCEWAAKFEKLHQSRKNIWKVGGLYHPNGMKEYRLYTMIKNEPVCSSAITIAKNKVDTFSIKLEDVAPLLREVIKDHPPIFFLRYRNNRNTYCFRNDSCDKYFFATVPEAIKRQREETRKINVDKSIFLDDTFEAGEASGLIDTIEALKCLEVLLA